MRSGLPKRILVPVDLSENANAALKEAAAVAEKCNAELIVLYADELIPPLDPSIELPQRFVDMTDSERKVVVQNELERRVDAIVPASVHVDSIVKIDRTVHAILTTAEEKDADWIVMVTHGHDGLKRTLQGSVTEEVIRHTTRPVLAVHAAA